MRVARGDSPWSLAERHLGDGLRWRELWDLNRGVPQADGRAWVVDLSDEGRRRMADLTTARRARLGRLLGEWTDDELSTFVTTLGRYNASLDD